MLEIGKRILNDEKVSLCFFGDSITEGCFEFNDDFSDTSFKRDLGYPYKLQTLIKERLNKDVHIINAGKSGNNTVKALRRFNSDVLSRKPDFCLVMFGSNDVVNIEWGEFDQDTYLNNMTYIFNTLKLNNIEIACMTPSMMATEDKGTLKDTKYYDMLQDCIKIQTSGVVDKFFLDLKDLCTKLNVPVIDVYSIWKKKYAEGEDVTSLLSNDINHPNEIMHEVFAEEIYKKMFNDETK